MPDLRIGIDGSGSLRGAADVERAGKRVETTVGRLSIKFQEVAKHLAAITVVVKTVQGIQDAVRTLEEYETKLIAVGKTANISGEALDELGRKSLDLSQKLALPIGGILDIETVAGQLGIKGSQNILKFTNTLGQLELSTDVVGEKGARSIARILKITGESISEVDKFGSILTRLGNDAVASETEILEVAKEVGKVSGVYRLSSANVLALATSYKELGVAGATGATSTLKAFRVIDAAARDGGDALTKIAGIAGLTGEQFKKAFEEDAFGAFTKFVVGLGQLERSGGSAVRILDELELSDARLLKTLGPLISQYEVLQANIARVADEQTKYSSLSEEARKATEALGKQWQLLKNSTAQVILEQVNYTESLTSLVKFVKGTILALAGLATEEANVSEASKIAANSIRFLYTEAKLLIAIKLASVFIGWGKALVTFLKIQREAIAIFGLSNVLTIKATASTNALSKAFVFLNATVSKNPFIVGAIALGTLVAAITAFNTETTKAISYQEALNNAQETSEATVDRLATAQAAYNRALKVADVQEAINAVNAQIDTVKTQAIELQKALDTADPLTPPTISLSELEKTVPSFKKVVKAIEEELSKADPLNALDPFKQTQSPDTSSLRTALGLDKLEEVTQDSLDKQQSAAVQAFVKAKQEIDKNKLLEGFAISTVQPGEVGLGVLEAELVRLQKLSEEIQAEGLNFSGFGDSAATEAKKLGLATKEVSELAAKLEDLKSGKSPFEFEVDKLVSGFAGAEADRAAFEARARDLLTEFTEVSTNNTLDEILAKYKRETELLKLSNDERAVAQALDSVREAAAKSTLGDQELSNKLLEDKLKLVEAEVREQLRLEALNKLNNGKLTSEYRALETSAQNALVDPIEEAVFEGQKLKETLQDIGRELLKLTVREAVLNPIASQIAAPFASAIGGLNLFGQSKTTNPQGQTPAQAAGDAAGGGAASAAQAAALGIGASQGGAGGSQGQAALTNGGELAQGQAGASAGLFGLSLIPGIGLILALAGVAYAATRKNAKGNAFSGGRLIPHSKGVIFGGPTFYDNPDGSSDVFGEGGLEAAVPLVRNSRGEMAVQVDGGGGKRRGGNYFAPGAIVFKTPDAGSFRRSNKSVKSDLQKLIRSPG